MAVSNPENLLIVEDDPDVAEMIAVFFRGKGYHVVTAERGEEGLDACQTRPPDLVILDIRLPDLDGYEVARRLRADRHTSHIPIVFLTERRERQDRLYGLELGADEYITKPFDFQELHLRVRNALDRARQKPMTNAITSLPQGALVEEQFRMCLNDDGWSMGMIALERLDLFRDRYGFVAADDVIRAVGLILQKLVREYGGEEDFIGHLSADQFLWITRKGGARHLEELVKERLEAAMSYFYPQGEVVGPAERLAIHLYRLDARQGPFRDLNTLQQRLRQQEFGYLCK